MPELIDARMVSLGGSKPLASPRIPNPRCPEHCIRHEVESELECPRCGARPFYLLAHRWPHNPDMVWYSTHHRDGAPHRYHTFPRCCQEVLVRAEPAG